MKKELEQIIELLDSAEDIKPIIDKSIKALRLISPEIKSLLDDVSIYVVDKRAEQVKRLMVKHGFNKDDAIMLTLDVNHRIEKSLQKFSDKSNNKSNS